MSYRRLLPLAAASLALFTSAAVHAGGFDCITGSAGVGVDADGCSTEGQSWLEWSLAGNVLTVSNLVAPGNGSSITGFSFDLSAGQTVSLGATQMAGVLFTAGGSGANLPASLGWTIDSKFERQSRGGVNNGVNAGESIVFDLSGVSLANVEDGSFRFGVHLQAMTGGRSEKLVAVTPTIPEPQTWALMAAGLGFVGWRLRKSRDAA